MEKFSSGLLAAILVFVLPAGLCLAKDKPPYKTISEEAVRTISAEMYSAIITISCLKGRRYPARYIQSGFAKYYDEKRLDLLSAGYTIIPTIVIQISLPHMIAPPSQMAFDANRRLALPQQFGCFRPYWLDDERQY